MSNKTSSSTALSIHNESMCICNTYRAGNCTTMNVCKRVNVMNATVTFALHRIRRLQTGKFYSIPATGAWCTPVIRSLPRKSSPRNNRARGCHCRLVPSKIFVTAFRCNVSTQPKSTYVRVSATQSIPCSAFAYLLHRFWRIFAKFTIFTRN